MNNPLHPGWSFEKIGIDGSAEMHIGVHLRFMIQMSHDRPSGFEGEGPLWIRPDNILAFNMFGEECEVDGLPALRAVFRLDINAKGARRTMEIQAPEEAIRMAGLPLDTSIDRVTSVVEYFRLARADAGGDKATTLLEGASILMREARPPLRGIHGLRLSSPWSECSWPTDLIDPHEAQAIVQAVDAHAPRTIALAVEERTRKRIVLSVRAHHAKDPDQDSSIGSLRSVAAVPESLKEFLR